MNLTITNQTCEDIIFNGHYLEKLYFGNDLVWEKQHAHDYSQDYFTIESLENGNTITLEKSSNLPNVTSIAWSKDKINWNTYTPTSASLTITVTANANEKIYWKGIATSYGWGRYYTCFASTKNINVSGNIMSLLYGDDFTTTIYNTVLRETYTFSNLFNNCKKLLDAKNLILPALTLCDYCYNNMFAGCNALTAAPELPATTLVHSCYTGMFRDCTHLTTAPELPATTLAQGCYIEMFDGCLRLTSAPELPAMTLASACYGYMFKDCTSLTTAPSLSATTLASGCYGGMFYNCTSLVNVPLSLPATTLASGCYKYMFDGCTSLRTAPDIPATTLASNCCEAMFSTCSLLVNAPSILPATTLADHCYDNMFAGCNALTTAPELPALTLVDYCYSQMFDHTRVNYIKCLATDISATNCLFYWLDNNSSTSGTFIKNSSMSSWPRGKSGIPNGWTVVNAS